LRYKFLSSSGKYFFDFACCRVKKIMMLQKQLEKTFFV